MWKKIRFKFFFFTRDFPIKNFYKGFPFKNEPNFDKGFPFKIYKGFPYKKIYKGIPYKMNLDQKKERKKKRKEQKRERKKEKKG